METDLFVHFAEIAGVFVGFGALISLRSARPKDPHDFVYIQAVLGLGVWVVIAALVPIVVSQYGVHDEALWRPCALVPLAVWAIFVIALSRTAASRKIDRSPERVDRLFPVLGLPLHFVLAGSLLLIVIGLWPGIDEALYITSLAAGVIFAGYTLLMSGMSQAHPLERDQDGP
jgi:FtsH-binding integral membrane protein